MEKKSGIRSKGTDAGVPRHVLIADDGSEAAAHARGFGLLVAAAAGARLSAVYVCSRVERAAQGHRKLAGVLAAATAAGLHCKALVERPVGVTNPGRRILAAGERARADLIVVGARGAGLVRKLLGSVSSYVVNRARVSVCVVR